MAILGLIPARGGSKGVLRKNIRLVAGRPLIAYTVEAAKRSRTLTHIVASTDDPEIASIAERLGSRVLLRPASLAADETPMVAVVQHALAFLEPTLGRFDGVAILQPTTPLRTADDIDAALNILITSGAESVVSVYAVGDGHPARMYRLLEERLIPYESEPPERLRQGLPALYHRNGAIYACRRHVIDDQHTLIGRDARPYLMPRARSLNIDDEFDLLVADLLIQQLRRSPSGMAASHAHS